MAWIDYIAFNRNIRGEEPNKELAKELSELEEIDGIKEIADNIYDNNKSIASDCIAVLYNIGYLKPSLIAKYLDLFMDLLNSKNNRMVWGGMIAISTICNLKASQIYEKIDIILNKTETGSLITQIHGINVLLKLSLKNKKYKKHLKPILFEYLNSCRPIDFGKRVELLLPVLEDEDDKKSFELIIIRKVSSLSESQNKKLKTILNRFNKNSTRLKLTIL